MLLTIIWLEIWDALAYCQSWYIVSQKLCSQCTIFFFYLHKANLKDLIAATGLVIPYWIQIVDFPACVTLKFDGWPRKVTGHFFYTTSSFVCASFQTHQWIQAKVTVRKRLIRVEIDILSLWPWNLKDDHGKQQGTSSILQAVWIISKSWVNSNWSYSPKTLDSGLNRQFFVPCDLDIWWMTSEK